MDGYLFATACCCYSLTDCWDICCIDTPGIHRDHP
uniref:Uncharacterized protein n=1 Tax=Anguilla anguilla TaxID=7936 RepID=A0A0E9WMF5_ANGAN